MSLFFPGVGIPTAWNLLLANGPMESAGVSFAVCQYLQSVARLWARHLLLPVVQRPRLQKEGAARRGRFGMGGRPPGESRCLSKVGAICTHNKGAELARKQNPRPQSRCALCTLALLQPFSAERKGSCFSPLWRQMVEEVGNAGHCKRFLV